MKLNFFKYIAYTAILATFATFAGCVYDFQADLSSQGISSEYIIVDGDIIVGDTSVIYIGKTGGVTTKDISTSDWYSIGGISASVWVESETGQTWWGKDSIVTISYTKKSYYYNYKYEPYTQNRYFIDTRDLDINGKYRLCVSIPGIGEYVTPFREVMIAQEIDSLSYRLEPDNSVMNLMLSSSGNEGQSKYYRWNYREDWENNPPIMPQVTYNYRDNSIGWLSYEVKDSLRKCMAFSHSYDILVYNTNQLAENRLENYLFLSFPTMDRRMVGLYCLTLYQTPLDREGYDFYKAMSVNDNLGGLYAPYPNEIMGNVLCTTNSNKVALGYVNVCTRSMKRIFIDGGKLNLIDRNKGTKERIMLKEEEWRGYFQGKDYRPYDFVKDYEKDSVMYDKAYWGHSFWYGIGQCSPRPYFWPKK